MSYEPPTEEEWNATHKRLTRYVEFYRNLAVAMGEEGEVVEMCHAQHIILKARVMTARLEALRFALGMSDRLLGFDWRAAPSQGTHREKP